MDWLLRFALLAGVPTFLLALCFEEACSSVFSFFSLNLGFLGCSFGLVGVLHSFVCLVLGFCV